MHTYGYIYLHAYITYIHTQVSTVSRTPQTLTLRWTLHCQSTTKKRALSVVVLKLCTSLLRQRRWLVCLCAVISPVVTHGWSVENNWSHNNALLHWSVGLCFFLLPMDRRTRDDARLLQVCVHCGAQKKKNVNPKESRRRRREEEDTHDVHTYIYSHFRMCRDPSIIPEWCGWDRQRVKQTYQVKSLEHKNNNNHVHI